MLRKGQKQLVSPAARQGKCERGGGGEKLNLSLFFQGSELISVN